MIFPRFLAVPCLVVGAAVLHGCGGEDVSGPPSVNYGTDVCAECNMILSDDRFAAATVVQGPRGPTPLLFDDYNCQINHARANPGLVVLHRWAHDHGTRAWIDSSAAHFVHSERIRSPMASRLAAFAARADAEAMAAELGGRILSFDAALAGATEPEHAAPCCSDDADPDAGARACCGGAGGACCWGGGEGCRHEEPETKEDHP